MFNPKIAREIERHPIVASVRRILFTHSDGPEPNRFERVHFYQFGSGIVIIRASRLYLLTASHVVRNATQNNYSNDSPFWVTRTLRTPEDFHDFLMPMRIVDLDPAGETGRDVALAEIADMPNPVEGMLYWDDPSNFVRPDHAAGQTAVAIGYPCELNEYTFSDEYVPFANVVRVSFKGVIQVEGKDVWFLNRTHKTGFNYAGLSGGLVACSIEGRIKCVGLAVSSGDEGRRFRVIPFADIRRWFEPFHDLKWQVLDEAYLVREWTHESTSHLELRRMLTTGDEPVRIRSNDPLRQLMRCLDDPKFKSMQSMLQKELYVIRGKLLQQLAQALKEVSDIRSGVVRVRPSRASRRHRLE